MAAHSGTHQLPAAAECEHNHQLSDLLHLAEIVDDQQDIMCYIRDQTIQPCRVTGRHICLGLLM